MNSEAAGTFADGAQKPETESDKGHYSGQVADRHCLDNHFERHIARRQLGAVVLATPSEEVEDREGLDTPVLVGGVEHIGPGERVLSARLMPTLVLLDSIRLLPCWGRVGQAFVPRDLVRYSNLAGGAVEVDVACQKPRMLSTAFSLGPSSRVR